MVTKHPDNPPCGYVKALFLVIGALVTLFIYGAGSVSELSKVWKSDHDALIELKTDMRYIRQAVDQIAANQKKP